MNDLTVRPSRRADFRRLERAFNSWHPDLVAVGENTDGWLVAEVGGVVVGGLLAREFCGWEDDALVGYGQLTEEDVVPFASLMCVQADHRGQGIGTKLMTTWIDRTPAWARVIAPDQSDDTASRAARARFFERLGFAWIPTAYDTLEPWLMIRASGPAPIGPE